MGLTISGGEGFEQFLNSRIKIGSEVIDITKRNGAEMQQKAQQLAPVDTGFLKRSINLNFENKIVTFSSVVSGNANYDAYQEYGTRYMPGTPHIRPAFFYQKQKFIDEISKAAKR